MGKIKKILKICSLTAFLLTSAILSDQSLVFANVGPDSPPNAIKLDGIFQTPSNSNSLVLTGDKRDIVQLTDSVKSQVGAIWSTEVNKIDLTKDFESSMYIYFGNRGRLAADGMTFVMHNDPNVIQQVNLNSVGRQLGVWANPDESSFVTGNINNSFAVEFDTYDNRDDLDHQVLAENHIAWALPAKATSYRAFRTPAGYTKLSLVHNDIQYPGLLSNDEWHQFKVKWDSKQSILSYQFGNQPIVNVPIDVTNVFKGTEVYWGFTGSTGYYYEMNRMVFEKVPGLVDAEVKEDILHSTTNESVLGTNVAGSTKLTYSLEANYLGGKQSWRNINVSSKIDSNVDYVPGTLRVKDEAGNVTKLDDSHWNNGILNLPISDMDLNNPKQTILFDVITKKVVQDTAVSESSSFEGLNYITHTPESKYTIMKYTAPEIVLNNEGKTITSNLNSDVDISGTWKEEQGKEVTLTYKLNGEVIGTEMLQSTQENTYQDWKYSIPNNKLKLGLNDLEVYVTNGLGASSETKRLSILVLSPPTVTLENSEETIDYGKSLRISGTVSDLDGAAKELILYYVIDDKDPVAFSKATNSNLGEINTFAGEILTAGVNEGSHTISVYAVDEDGLQSNTTQFILHVVKRLAFADGMKNIEFVTTQIGSMPKISERTTNYPIHIINSKGKGSKWKLKAELTKPLVSIENHTLEGLFFKKPSGETEELLLNNSVIVESGESLEDYSDINLNWTNDEGLLLKVDSSSYIGSYAGELTWILEDTP